MGNKANNLAILEDIGVNVPSFRMYNITQDYVEVFTERFGMFVRAFLNPYYEGKYAVRSSGSVSTPGRMKTVLNVDFNDLVEAGVKVFNSSQSDRLENYLKLKGVTDFSAAIVVQQMVDPTLTEHSCSGVLTTCHPITGKNGEYGEVVFGKMGEDLMSGKKDPLTLQDLEKRNPTGYANLLTEIEKIRVHFPNHQEVEFVIEDTTAWIVQTRDYKNVTPLAADFEGYELVGFGRPATPLSVVGFVTTDIERINDFSIYLTDTTDWEDTEQILKGRGVITKTGGSLSHAAIIAREFELPCITSVKMKDEQQLSEGMKIGINSMGQIFKM